MGVAFIAIERRSRDPLLPFRMLRNACLALALIVACLFMVTFGALLYFLSIYFQDVLHYDALQTGLTFLPPTTVVVIASALAGRVVTKIGLRLTMIIALSAGALGALAVRFAISPNASFFGFLPGLIAVSVGDGVTFTTMFIAASTGVPDRQQGVASGIVSTASGIGAVLGLAVLVLVANLGTDNLDGEPLRAAVAAAIARVAYTIARGVLVMLIIVRGRIGLRGANSGEMPSP